MELLSKMSRVVEETMTHYQSDFEEDKKLIAENPQNPFIWIVRTTGTHFCPLDRVFCRNTASYNVVQYFDDSYSGVSFYLAEPSNNLLKRINREQAQQYIKRHAVKEKQMVTTKDGFSCSKEEYEFHPYYICDRHGPVISKDIVPESEKELRDVVAAFLSAYK